MGCQFDCRILCFFSLPSQNTALYWTWRRDVDPHRSTYLWVGNNISPNLCSRKHRLELFPWPLSLRPGSHVPPPSRHWLHEPLVRPHVLHAQFFYGIRHRVRVNSAPKIWSSARESTGVKSHDVRTVGNSITVWFEQGRGRGWAGTELGLGKGDLVSMNNDDKPNGRLRVAT